MSLPFFFLLEKRFILIYSDNFVWRSEIEIIYCEYSRHSKLYKNYEYFYRSIKYFESIVWKIFREKIHFICNINFSSLDSFSINLKKLTLFTLLRFSSNLFNVYVNSVTLERVKRSIFSSMRMEEREILRSINHSAMCR